MDNRYRNSGLWCLCGMGLSKGSEIKCFGSNSRSGIEYNTARIKQLNYDHI